jgi:DNA-binding transcriptional LysR family regulator
MNLDIDALRSFAAVADERSFTRAAQAVSRTQSAVSVQIKNLEGRLGFLLFERTRRTVALTPRGEQLLAYARDILRCNDEGVRALTAPQAQGRLRLGITEYLAPQQLPGLLQVFVQQHPGVMLEVTTGVTGTLLKLQRAGELDLVVGRTEVGRSEVGSAGMSSAAASASTQALRRERLRWVAAPGLQLSRSTPVPLALLPSGCGVRTLALAALDAQGRAWRPVYCGPSVLGLQAAVAAGMAVACLTHSAVQPGFKQLGAREGLPALPDSELVLFKPRARASSEMRLLQERVADYFAQPLPTV